MRRGKGEREGGEEVEEVKRAVRIREEVRRQKERTTDVERWKMNNVEKKEWRWWMRGWWRW